MVREQETRILGFHKPFHGGSYLTEPNTLPCVRFSASTYFHLLAAHEASFERMELDNV